MDTPMRLRYCRTSPRGDVNYAWFDTSIGRRLPDTEVQSMVGREERWTARFDDGTERVLVATVDAYGFLNEGDRVTLASNASKGTSYGIYPKSTALRAIRYDVGSKRRIVSLRGPNGEAPDIVRVRFVSGDVVTEPSHFWLRDDLLDSHELHGARAPCGEGVSGWTYGFGGVRHVENVRKAAGDEEYYDATSDELRRAGKASARANVAIFRALRALGPSLPVWRLEWVQAAIETGIAVEIQINNGPWMPVDGRGRTSESAALGERRSVHG